MLNDADSNQGGNTARKKIEDALFSKLKSFLKADYNGKGQAQLAQRSATGGSYPA